MLRDAQLFRDFFSRCILGEPHAQRLLRSRGQSRKTIRERVGDFVPRRIRPSPPDPVAVEHFHVVRYGNAILAAPQRNEQMKRDSAEVGCGRCMAEILKRTTQYRDECFLSQIICQTGIATDRAEVPPHPGLMLGDERRCIEPISTSFWSVGQFIKHARRTDP